MPIACFNSARKTPSPDPLPDCGLDGDEVGGDSGFDASGEFAGWNCSGARRISVEEVNTDKGKSQTTEAKVAR